VLDRWLWAQRDVGRGYKLLRAEGVECEMLSSDHLSTGLPPGPACWEQGGVVVSVSCGMTEDRRGRQGGVPVQMNVGVSL